jgi:lauroyl/myristoyl acyltransferase
MLYSRWFVLNAAHAVGFHHSRRIARWLAGFLYDYIPEVRERVRRPLKAAYGGSLSEAALERVARACVEHSLYGFLETEFIERRIRPGTWRRYVRLVGIEPLVGAVRAGRGIVVAGVDFGNNEVGVTLAGCVSGGRIAAIVAPVQSTVHRRWMAGLVRRRLAVLYPRRGALASSERALEEGRILFVIANHPARRGRGVTVDFLGRTVPYYPTVAMLAARTCCPLAVITCVRRDEPFQFELRVRDWIEPPPGASLEWVQEATRRVLRCLASAVRESPEQYLWYRQLPFPEDYEYERQTIRPT